MFVLPTSRSKPGRLMCSQTKLFYYQGCLFTHCDDSLISLCRFKPLRYRLAYCTVNWLLMLLCCIVPVFNLSEISSVYLLISTALFFLLLMSYGGVHVLCVLKQPGPGDGERDCESRNTMKRKAFRVIMITLVFTCTNQLLLVSILGSVLWFVSLQVILLVTLVSLSISIVSGFIAPLLYLHRVGKLRCIQL